MYKRAVTAICKGYSAKLCYICCDSLILGLLNRKSLPGCPDVNLLAHETTKNEEEAADSAWNSDNYLTIYSSAVFVPASTAVGSTAFSSSAAVFQTTSLFVSGWRTRRG